MVRKNNLTTKLYTNIAINTSGIYAQCPNDYPLAAVTVDSVERKGL